VALPWFRLYSEFAFDPKVQSMSEVMQRRFVMLMCLRCTDDLGKLSDEEIAFALRIPVEEIEETKAVLTSKDLLVDGWYIRAWDKRQYRSDDSKERARRYRERQKANTVTPPSPLRHANITAQDTDTDSEESKPLVHSPDEEKPKSEYEAKTAESFEANFWANWPRKDKKKDALKAFRAVFPKKQSQSQKMTRWQNFKLHLAKTLTEYQTRGTQPQYILLGASWLRAQDFDAPPEADEYTARIEWEEVPADGG
jgi:hypothetical protein